MSDTPPTPIRVLVVDDSAEIRDVIRLALDRATDFELVAEASDGETGVAAARAHQPGLVLLDIAMPEMDGLQALPLIRSVVPAASVVVFSGFSEQDAADISVGNGADGFIRKGRNLTDVLDQLREIVANRARAPRPERSRGQ